MGTGMEQLGYVDPVNKGAEMMAGEPTHSAEWYEGGVACDADTPFGGNPYAKGTVKQADWCLGWNFRKCKELDQEAATPVVYKFDPETEIVVNRKDFEKVRMDGLQCARLRKDIGILREHLAEEGIDAPPGPDLVTLHATLVSRMVSGSETWGAIEDGLEFAGDLAAKMIRNAIAFADSQHNAPSITAEEAGERVGGETRCDPDCQTTEV